jgi:acyl phosphate:glycerol-3-phosphate acyltransferase
MHAQRGVALPRHLGRAREQPEPPGVVLLAYLMGAIPTGLIVARIRGVDIQRAGSGNIGATNVARSVGPWAGVIVMLVDPLKGVLAVTVPTLLGLDPWWVTAAALAAVVGNGFNVFLGFRAARASRPAWGSSWSSTRG